MDVAGSRLSYLLGTAEPEVVEFLIGHVQKGDLVFDLGANVGYFTLIASVLAGPTGRVVAYEPVPENVRALRNNIELNSLTNVEIVEAAVSASDGLANIAVSSTDDQQATLVAPRDSNVEVRTVTLDSEAKRVGAPRVIKCDIEGAEYEAFAAASVALSAGPAIMCEVHRMQDGDEDRFDSILRDRGFQTRWVDRREEGWTARLVALPDNHS